MDQRAKTSQTKKLVGEGLIQKGRKFGQTKPQTPSGKVKQWQPPSKGTSPANRKKDS